MRQFFKCLYLYIPIFWKINMLFTPTFPLETWSCSVAKCCWHRNAACQSNLLTLCIILLWSHEIEDLWPAVPLTFFSFFEALWIDDKVLLVAEPPFLYVMSTAGKKKQECFIGESAPLNHPWFCKCRSALFRSMINQGVDSVWRSVLEFDFFQIFKGLTTKTLKLKSLGG